MPRSANQKLKLLYLAKLFQEQTDEDHPLTLQQLIDKLSEYGICAERKSIYDDMEALRTFGMDICSIRSRTTGYYLGHRKFELPELKLLVDSMTASKFLTEKKTLALIRKLSSLTNVHQARQMQRQVYVAHRIKTMNESIYYNVDKLHSAIAQSLKITFRYFEYNLDKSRSYRHGGAHYRVSPHALMLAEENYYLVAFDDKAGVIKHYRVDKMDSIQVTLEPAEGQEEFKEVDLSAYTRHVFGMFGGELQRVTLRLSNRFIGVVIDRFGKDIVIRPVDEDYFEITPSVSVSPQFFGWLFGLGQDAYIVSPASVVQEMRAYTQAVLARYEPTPS